MAAAPTTCRRLRGLQVQLQRQSALPGCCLTAASRSSDAAETERLRSPWSDAEGSIRAAWVQGDRATFTRSDRKKGFAVLSEADHDFFEREGWVLVRKAVPRENVEAMKDATVRPLIACLVLQRSLH